MNLFEKYINLQPMKYYDKDKDDLSPTLQIKRKSIIENANNNYIATRKNDGEWAMFIKSDNQIKVRSRSLSVKGGYGDFTEKVPHLIQEMQNWPEGTVVLGELCYPVEGSTSRDVGCILRCLPAKAIERQKKHTLCVKIFDILAYDNVDIMNEPYISRLDKAKEFLNNYNSNYFSLTDIYEDNFSEVADMIISSGGEGLVIQQKNNPYMPGTRTAWKTLKLKQKLPVMELQVVGVIDPNKYYDGISESIWDYWEGLNTKGERVLLNKRPKDAAEYSILTAITKPYYYGRKVGVKVLYNGTEVSATSGCTDEIGEWLAQESTAELIAQGKVFAQIKSMMESQNGALRHPVLVDVRILDKED